jgi:hypothetical protein
MDGEKAEMVFTDPRSDVAIESDAQSRVAWAGRVKSTIATRWRRGNRPATRSRNF